MYKAKVTVVLLALLSIINYSCDSRNAQPAGGRTEELAAIDSLLGARDGNVILRIDSGMGNADGTMSWYELYARKARYYGLSATPDSLLPILDNVESYAKANEASERGRQLLAYAYNCRAAYYHNFHKHTDKTIAIYKQAYDILMASEDKTQAPKVAANLGDACAFDNDLPKAAAWYRRALFLVDSLRLPAKENVTLYLGLASICQQLGDNETALAYYKQTEKHMGDMSVSMQAYFLNNFGSYYYYKKEYENALSMFLELRHLLERNGMQDNFDMFLCKVNLADVCLNLGNLKDARAYIAEVEPFAKNHGDPVMLYYCHTIRLGIAVKAREWGEVKDIVNEDSDNMDIPFQLKHIRNRYLCEYYTSVGNYEQAYKDLRQDMAFNDSLEHNRINMRTADIMTQLTADTLRLHSDLVIEQQRADNNRTRFVATMAFAIVVALILMLVIVRQRSRKRLADAIIKIMDLRLSNARSRFSPHFVFNILNNYILSNEDRNDSRVLRKLTKLIRSGLDMSRKMLVTLDDELDYVNDYVNLEKPKPEEDFEYVLSVEDGIDAKNIYVPSMLVQMMVENALVHGLKGWDGHKALRIDISRKERNVVIKVTDNGHGFHPAEVSMRKGNGLNIIRQTIGVLNKYNRQKIIFGMENVKGTDGKVAGCTATLSIPDNLKDMKDITSINPNPTI